MPVLRSTKSYLSLYYNRRLKVGPTVLLVNRLCLCINYHRAFGTQVRVCVNNGAKNAAQRPRARPGQLSVWKKRLLEERNLISSATHIVLAQTHACRLFTSKAISRDPEYGDGCAQTSLTLNDRLAPTLELIRVRSSLLDATEQKRERVKAPRAPLVVDDRRYMP